MSKFNNKYCFHWEGTTANKILISGTIKARNINIVKIELQQQGITITKISKSFSDEKLSVLFFKFFANKTTVIFPTKESNTRPIMHKFFSKINLLGYFKKILKIINNQNLITKKISVKEITSFSKQLANLLNTGLTLIDALNLIGKSHENLNLQKLINNIILDLKNGFTLSYALQKHPKIFNNLFCNLVSTGEISGNFTLIFNKIFEYRDHKERLQNKIKKSLSYPVIVLIVALLSTLAILFFVIPQFQQIFSDFDGATLPWLTIIVIKTSDFLQKHFFFLLSLMIGLITIFIQLKQKNQIFALKIDEFIIKVPVIGKLINKMFIARFTYSLSITLSSGNVLEESLQNSMNTISNKFFHQKIIDIKQQVTNGYSLNKSMINTGIFPQMVIHFVALGEESATLDEMLTKIAILLEQEFDMSIDSFSNLLEPFIMCILGIILGVLIIAMYLPIFKLGAII